MFKNVLKYFLLDLTPTRFKFYKLFQTYKHEQQDKKWFLLKKTESLY